MDKKLYLIQSKANRFFHWTLISILLLKILSGLYMAYPAGFLSFKIIRNLHFFLIFPLFFWLVARVYFALVSGDYKNIIPTLKDIKIIPHFLKYELYLTAKKPPQGKYNVGQKIVFTSWGLVILFQLFSGFALYDPTLSGFGDLLVGGFNYIRWYHYLAALYLTITITVHIYLVFSSNLPRLKAIFTGYIIRKQPN